MWFDFNRSDLHWKSESLPKPGDLMINNILNVMN